MVDVCDIPVISGVCDVAGEAAGSLVSAPFDYLAQSMGNAAGWMFESVWRVFDSTTMVDVTSSHYTKVYNILFGVAVFVMLGFFMLQVIGGMIRREPAALSRAALGMAKSVLGSFVALTLLATALELTDQLCVGIVKAAGTNMEEMGDRIVLLVAGLGAISLAAPGAGAIVTIFIAGLAIGGAVIVWVSLLVRKALLLIAIVFAPIALAGASWDHTRGWIGRWAGFVLALILSKVVLVVIFLLATAQVSAPIDSDLASASEPIAGVVLMLMAAFAPYLTYKAISFMGFDMHQAMSAEQETKSAMNRPMPIPLNRQSGSTPRKVLGGGPQGGSTATGGGGPSPAPAAAPGARGGARGGAGGGAGRGGGGVAGGGSAGGLSSGRTGGAAGGGVAAGLAIAKQSFSAGVSTGRSVGAAASQQIDAANQAPPSAAASPPPHVADPVPASNTKKGRGR
ncbi:conjugal transfer protein TrbL [Nocardioides sp. S5]|uniref:conjugal transfer protein TrbL n=1 Tax=Nocardioides sp. S5 TaxID=2017486 RepID=UPI001A8F3A36|nr:conjugal transfer protein TrbL [Nocardioides sp. S5]QSR31307.1 conjugal transfer protein TrbL [Nocardioides sp. S5]